MLTQRNQVTCVHPHLPHRISDESTLTLASERITVFLVSLLSELMPTTRNTIVEAKDFGKFAGPYVSGRPPTTTIYLRTISAKPLPLHPTF